MNYSINRANQAQIYDFLKENDSAFNPPFSFNVDLKTYSNKLKSNATIYEVWEEDDLVGILASYYNKSDGSAFIPYICVSRIGLGSGLFSFFLSQIDAVNSIYLEVRKNNMKAISFYEKFAFCIVSQSYDKYMLKKEL